MVAQIPDATLALLVTKAPGLHWEGKGRQGGEGSTKQACFPRETKQDSLPPFASTSLRSTPWSPSGVAGYKGGLTTRPPGTFAWAARDVASMCTQHANLMHVIPSPFGVWPKLLNNQQINLRKISLGLRGKPVLFSLNRGLKPYVRDQRCWLTAVLEYGMPGTVLCCWDFLNCKSFEGVLGCFSFLPRQDQSQLQTVLREVSMTSSHALKSIIYKYMFAYIMES